MFVVEETQVALPAESAWARMLAYLNIGHLQDTSDDAFGAGRELLLRAGVPGVVKRVHVQALPAYLADSTLVVPIRWVASGSSGSLFPQLDANLEICDIGSDGCLLRLAGSYRPPLGGLGTGLDRLLLHRVADATARTMLRELADELVAMDEPAVPFSESHVARRH